jgi:hypothetical protein
MSNEILDALKGEEPEITPEPEPKKDQSLEKISELESALMQSQNMISQLNGKIDTLTNVINKPKVEEEFDDSEELTPEQVLEITRRERREENKKMSLSQKQAEWDRRTDADFGTFGFNDKSSTFYKETFKEYNSLDKDEKDSPRAVYDSAARVFSKGMREGWIKQNVLETAKRNHAIASGTLEGGLPPRRNKKQDKETTDAQMFFGKKLGFSEDKVKKIYDSRGTA